MDVNSFYALLTAREREGKGGEGGTAFTVMWRTICFGFEAFFLRVLRSVLFCRCKDQALGRVRLGALVIIYKALFDFVVFRVL